MRFAGVFSCVFIALAAVNVLGYGPKVHAAIFILAISRLSAQRKARMMAFLPPDFRKNPSLVANWPDNIRDDPNYITLERLHYIDQRMSDEEVPPVAKHEPRTWNICCALNYFARKLLYRDTGPYPMTRPPALTDWQMFAFVVHLMADIAQPMHNNAPHRGGNDIEVYAGQDPTSLHLFWDFNMFDLYCAEHKGEEKTMDKLTLKMHRTRNPHLLDSPVLKTKNGRILDDGRFPAAWTYSRQLKKTMERAVAEVPTDKQLVPGYAKSFYPILLKLIVNASLRLEHFILLLDNNRRFVPYAPAQFLPPSPSLVEKLTFYSKKVARTVRSLYRSFVGIPLFTGQEAL